MFPDAYEEAPRIEPKSVSLGIVTYQDVIMPIGRNKIVRIKPREKPPILQLRFRADGDEFKLAMQLSQISQVIVNRTNSKLKIFLNYPCQVFKSYRNGKNDQSRDCQIKSIFRHKNVFFNTWNRNQVLEVEGENITSEAMDEFVQRLRDKNVRVYGRYSAANSQDDNSEAFRSNFLFSF